MIPAYALYGGGGTSWPCPGGRPMWNRREAGLLAALGGIGGAAAAASSPFSMMMER
jgi:hypothetical protein